MGDHGAKERCPSRCKIFLVENYVKYPQLPAQGEGNHAFTSSVLFTHTNSFQLEELHFGLEFKAIEEGEEGLHKGRGVAQDKVEHTRPTEEIPIKNILTFFVGLKLPL